MLHSNTIYYHTKYRRSPFLKFTMNYRAKPFRRHYDITSGPIDTNFGFSSSRQILMLCSKVEENRTIITEITKTTLFEYIYIAKSLPDLEVVRRTMYIGKP